MKRWIALALALGTAAVSAACQNQEASATEASMSSVRENILASALETSESETTAPTEASANVEMEAPASDILIAYFTLGRNAQYPDDMDASTSASLVLDGEELVGTTEYVARLIQETVGGDLHAIETAEPYPGDFDAVVDQNHQEMNAGTLPELVASDLDLTPYHTVFIGYPVWATNAPQAIFSFLAQYNLTGKTIVPFCTHDGYGAGSSYDDIADAIEGEAAVLEGLAIEAPDVPGAAETVSSWLNDIGVGAQPDGGTESSETALTITIGDTVLEGVLYDTPLAEEIRAYFPLTVSMSGFGGREYYGGVDFYPENWEGGQVTFENGDITYCEAHHNMAIFYAQTDDPILSVEVSPIGRVTSDLAVFEELPGNVDVTFDLAE